MDASVDCALPLSFAVAARHLDTILLLLGMDTSRACDQVLCAMVDAGDPRCMVGGFAG
jgi:hypothetical protein